MLLNLENSLIYQPNTVTYDEGRSIANSSRSCCCLSGVGQVSSGDWCREKYGELCRSVANCVKKLWLNIADIF